MRLKELREEKGLLQREIAESLQTSQINISRWERGEVLPSSDFVVKLADFFEVTTDYLLGRSDDFGNVTVQSSPLALPGDEEQLLRAYRRLGGEYKKLAIDTLNTWAGVPAQKITTKRA